MIERKKIMVIAPFFILIALATLLGLTVEARSQLTADPLARIDGVAITSEEVEKAIGAPWGKLQEQIYALKRQKLEQLIVEKLLANEAAKRGLLVPALLDAEVTSKVGLVTEQEVEQYYQANKTRFQGDAAELRPHVRSELQDQKLAAQRKAFVESLRFQAQVVVNLKAPPIARVDVSSNGGIVAGQEAAPVTIVEFQDFHCPFCKRVQPTLAQIKARYGDKVKVVHRDLPLDRLHPQARKAHEAARCANDQGKFWPYHDLLYANSPAKPANFRQYAEEAGLDLAEFDKCVTSDTHKVAVQKDVDEAKRVGVSSTPTFFINGRQLRGSQPLDAFVQIIEDELSRSRTN